MSFKDRVVDGVGSLFFKLNEGAEVSAVDPEELEHELALRKAAHKASGSPKAQDNARARLAGAGEKARKQRISLAAKRLAKIRARRRTKAATQKRARDAAFENMAEEARRNPPPRPSRPRPSSSRGRSGARNASSSSRRSTLFQNKDMAQHYKTLGVAYGADATEVKKAYRKQMRKYHPDLHVDPKKKKAATQLTVRISVAYEAIEKHQKK